MRLHFGFWKVNILFVVMLLIYGLVSKSYSHPAIRLKKYPVIGWVAAGFFQGFFTFIMCYIGINNFQLENCWNVNVMAPAILSSLMLWGNYPMTQVYQHDEDSKRGDITLSLKLGVKNTFIFTAIFFAAASGGFVFYFYELFQPKYALFFLLSLSPVLLFFAFWFLKVIKSEANANWAYAMGLNFISATCLNLFFIYFFLDSSQVLQAMKAGY